MSKIRKTVGVELLRLGPTHNHLLSPLTQYMGLCGNFAAASVSVPYEQEQFEVQIEGLRYHENNSDQTQRHFYLDQFGQDIATIFGSIKGLTSELGEATKFSNGVINISLTLSAAELAMLPFELSKVPDGCGGGEGNWLLLQNRLPVTLTRRVRSVGNGGFSWPTHAKILLILASPRGLDVPAKQHLMALLEALNPWLRIGDGAERRKAIEDHLVIIENATTDAIKTACSQNQFTHVHILAHGMEDSSIPGSPYGLALHAHGDPNKIEVVDGQRLVSLLASDEISPDSGNNLPSVVTVAACDSGNTQSVIHKTGGSLAHDMHRAGISYVVASQFPLSKRGSVRLTSEFYRDILWGIDPRLAIARVRSSLHGLSADTHDWASIVTYGAMPDDIEAQLVSTQYHQSKSAIDTALHNIDFAIQNNSANSEFTKIIQQVDFATKNMPVGEGFEVEGIGLRASTEKRKAQALYQIALTKNEPSYYERSHHFLVDSLENYRQAYVLTMNESKVKVLKKSTHWVLGQFLSLQAVLGEPLGHDHWYAARLSCHIELTANDGITRAWAQCTLAELYLIVLAHPEDYFPISLTETRKKVIEHISEMMKLVRPDDFAIHSTKRQFERYTQWWGTKEFRESLEVEGIQRPLIWDEKSLILETAYTVIKQLS